MAPVSFDATEAQEVVRALAAVAAADGAILVREELFLEEFAIKHGVGAHAWIATPLDEVALARAVSEPDKRREVVALCLEMAHADHAYADSERDMIHRIAAALGISDAEVASMTQSAKIR
jgi:uncharacterized tellurite resistance protein B-like protein